MAYAQATRDAAWAGGATAGREGSRVDGSAGEPAFAGLVGVGADPLVYPVAGLDTGTTPDDGESDLVSHPAGRGAAARAGALELGRRGSVQLEAGLRPGEPP